MREIRAYLGMNKYVKNLKVFKNSNLWFTTYCVRPLQFFDLPNTFAYDIYSNLAKKEAMMILYSRSTSGIWEITW